MAEQKALSLENLQAAMSQNNTKLKEWVMAQIGKISVINIEWTNALPTEEISTNTIYMIKNDSSTTTNNIYNEYIYNETSGWEILGQVDVGSIDLTDYYTKTEVDNLLANISSSNYTDEEITTMITEIWSE